MGGDHPTYNVYDIRLPCPNPPLCGEYGQILDYMNMPEIKAELGVADREWNLLSQEVYDDFREDFVDDLSPLISQALDKGIGYLLYNGDKDVICNWIAGQEWVHRLEWTGQERFEQTEYQNWIVDGEEAGRIKTVDGLTHIRVYDSGHEVHSDQPKRALEMFKSFLKREI